MTIPVTVIPRPAFVPSTTPCKNRRKKTLSAPVMVNLELTSGCNIKCRHCYNYWREDADNTDDAVSSQTLRAFVDRFMEAGVFHVVLTGGEPLLNFNTLLQGLDMLHSAGISTSVNSNLMPVTPRRLARLKKHGLDHILTSLNSHDPSTNDYMVNRNGAFRKIVRGISQAIDSGIRVSVNMIISEPNQNHVYETAKLCAQLGVQKLFATRLVPSVRVADPAATDLTLQGDNVRRALDAMLQAKNDFGIAIGTLISYPLCALGDLQRYQDFVGRGCPAQSGNRMSVNADGTAHACTHEETGYGNILQEGIRAVFTRMRAWHNGSYLYPGCQGCDYIDICGSGCRMAAQAYQQGINGKDPLFRGFTQITRDYVLEVPAALIDGIESGERFRVPPRVRFRKEDGFYSINVRWANAFTIAGELAEFLIHKQASQQAFHEGDLPGDHGKRALLFLAFKDAVEAENRQLQARLSERHKLGCSINPFECSDAVTIQCTT